MLIQLLILAKYSSEVAFGGPVPILVIFLAINWRVLNVIGKISFLVVTYVISIGTGILSAMYLEVEDFNSAVIAGLIAPLVYSLAFSVLFKYTSNRFLRIFRNETSNWIPTDPMILDLPMEENDENEQRG